MTVAAPKLHIVLHQPEIPQNTGNIGRTCVALHAKLWLVRPLGFQLGTRELRRAGLDYWEHLQWETVADWEQLLACLPSSRLWLFTKKASRHFTDVSYQAGDALVFGGETQGLPNGILEDHAEQLLRIPTRREVRSLNLANAVAVAGYEAMRQWGYPGIS